MINERFLEIAKQARLKFPSETALSSAEEKFAELIVRECAFVGRGIGGINVSDAIMKRFGIPEARGWLCPSCGVDRGKEACPKGHHAALTGHCPMVGVAQ